MKILITTSTFGKYGSAPLDMLRNSGYELEFNPFGRKLTKKEAMSIYQNGVLGVIAGLEQIDEDVLKSAKDLKVISRCGAGIDNLDIPAAEKYGVKVYNTPFGPTEAVAELTLTLIFSLLKNILTADREMRKGIWNKKMGSLLRGKKVGIAGFGRIGEKVSDLLEKLGAKVSYYDPFVDSDSPSIVKKSLKQLLKESDIISLHLSYSDKNRNFIGKNELDSMKKTAFLVNTSRGGLIDEKALYDRLKRKKIAGAAIDVFAAEPYNGILTELDNIILTPHIGSYAKEARVEMETESVKNLLEGLR
jgi:D-3-phosphoglycerate dehydrogenase